MNRRFFLRGAAVVAPMLAIPAAASASDFAEENPVLLALDGEIDAAAAVLASATAYRADALKIGSRLWPRAPVELMRQWYCYGDTDHERTIDGAAYRIEPEGGERQYVRNIEAVRETAARVAMSRGPGSKARKAESARLLDVAEKYEAQKEHARRASGFADADRELDDAVAEVERLCHAIHAAEALTMAGVQIKAKALQAWGGVPRWMQLCAINGRDRWAPGLAASLLSVLEAGR